MFQKAKDYAFLLLKFRLRSEKEIYERLRRKKVDERTIIEVIVFLRDKGFLDDSLFTKTWIESRLKRPLGLRRIKEELKIKGINKELIESQIQKTKQDYREEDIVSKIVREKINKLKGIEPYKAKRRVFAYLLRRGFSSDIIADTLNKNRDSS